MTSGLLARFVTVYYAHLAPDDAKGRSTADLEGAARAHLRFAEDRPPGQPLVRVYTPSFDQDGYDSTHTIVEAVTDDMPFLVDSLAMELTRHGLGIHLVVHPIIGVRRDESGHLVDLDDAAPREAFMHFEVDRETDAAVVARLQADLVRVLGDVRAAVGDWGAMRRRALDVARALTDRSDAEAAALLEWMAADHFTFLGYRDTTAPESGLGILRGVADADSEPSHGGVTVRKSDARATVHRPLHMEEVCVGAHRFVGLWTSSAYNSSVRDVPLLRQKVEAVVERSDLLPTSHAGKDLESILETYPRDELFAIDDDVLYDTAIGILGLQERRRVRLFVRKDDRDRFFSCLVFLPRDRFTTEVARGIETILVDALGGTGVESTARMTESVLARLHVIVALPPGTHPAPPDIPAVEAQLIAAARSWSDDLADELAEHNGEERGVDLLRRYRDAFPAAYREDVDPRAAVGDVDRIEALLANSTGTDMMSVVTRPADAPRGFIRMKLYRAGEPMALSDVLPLLEHMGVRVVDEHPYEVHPADASPLWIYDIGLSSPDLSGLDAEAARADFCDAFGRLWRGEAESDGFNRLVLRAGLSSRKVAILRAYAKYMRQIGSTFSQAYLEDTLSDNPKIAVMLVQLFEARFDPSERADAEERQDDLAGMISASLREVASLDEDRILSSFLHLIQATLRTSWYQRDPGGNPKPYVSFKLDPARVPDLPLPRPMFEVWVYSPRCEGVHLRGGHIARGGIRWSDRREDFRTEILGLMKAQMVKNAVIVPVGSKGGFVLKGDVPRRPALDEYLI
ncbi:MAG TPA: NAD-glutamate dehydrogenase domain-containing protein, partial [Acidimicrobiales bacterium]|nr:NAD-glutamate dehydrogenase domain-containing protein [Acidimicrobiales bacterium]